MTWIPYALCAVICAAAMPLMQRRYKTDALAMLLWLRVATVIFLAPVVMTMQWPTAPVFYIGVISFSIIVTYTDYLIFNFARHNNPAISARLLKPAVIVTFLLWFVFDPHLLDRYIDHPERSIPIVFLLMIAVFLSMQLKKCAVTREALFTLWPVFCTVSLHPILSKYIMMNEGPWTGATIMVFITAITVIITTLIFQIVKKPISPDVLFHRRTMLVGAGIAIPSVLGGILIVMAFQAAAHPAYVSVVMMIVPVILSVVGRMLGDPDSGNRRAGFGLIAIAALIVILQIR